MNLPNFYSLTTTEMSAALIVFNILLAFVLSLAIVWIYRFTHRGLSYSQSFLATLIMISVLGSIVMMIVQNNIVGAFALLGAFSLIRFRTIVKDTRDVAFVFFSLVEGVAVGTANYAVAILSTLLVSGIILALYRFRFGSTIKEGYLLMLFADHPFGMEELERILRGYTDHFHALHIKSTGEGIDYSCALRMKQDKNPHELLSVVRKLPHVRSVNIMTGKESVEY